MLNTQLFTNCCIASQTDAPQTTEGFTATEPSSEFNTEITTEITNEVTTEISTEITNEVTTEISTEITNEVTTDAEVTEASTDEATVASTEEATTVADVEGTTSTTLRSKYSGKAITIFQIRPGFYLLYF